jgi:flavin-dependent dehydrogenase
MNKKFDCDVIIVGAGAAGIYAASTLKKLVLVQLF